MFERRYENLQVDAAPRSRTELIGVDGVGELIVQVENVGSRALAAIEISFYVNNRVANTLTDFATIATPLLETQGDTISTLAPNQWGIAYLDVRNYSSVVIKLVASGSFNSYPKEETIVNLLVKGKDFSRSSGGSGGSGGTGEINYVTLGTEVANRIAQKTLQVTGDSVDEAVLAEAIVTELTNTALTIDEVAIGNFPVDGDGNLKISKALAPSAGFSDDRAIATANQAEPLASSVELKNGAIVQAHENNTGIIIVRSTNGGIALEKKDRDFFPIDDPNKLLIVATVAGDRVRWWGS